MPKPSSSKLADHGRAPVRRFQVAPESTFAPPVSDFLTCGRPHGGAPGGPLSADDADALHLSPFGIDAAVDTKPREEVTEAVAEAAPADIPWPEFAELMRSARGDYFAARGIEFFALLLIVFGLAGIVGAVVLAVKGAL